MVGYFAEGGAYQISHAYKRGLGPILTKVAEFLARKKEAKSPIYVFFYCKSGRHRSVMCANITRYVLECPSNGLQSQFTFDNWTHLCEFHQVEGFVIGVFRNFFLDLSVDQIENLSKNFAKKFISEKIEENTPA